MANPSQYLDRYGEPEAKRVAGMPVRYRHCLVIPCYREPPDWTVGLARWLAVQNTGRILVILVVNQPDRISAAPDAANRQLVETLRERHPCHWRSPCEQLRLYRFIGEHDLLVVDRFDRGPAIPHRQGVGLARKIGADIACALRADGRLHSPWIHCSDADARLPTGYFEAAGDIDQRRVAALVYPFRHCPGKDDRINRCTELYEHSIKHYVDGLRLAGSRYAYHTIGSVLAINTDHYIQVRGFPKRAGGEDFYLLNKLRKTGDIESLSRPTIELRARDSDRVPFGTGPAVKQLMACETPEQSTIFYHPDIFLQLRPWLEQIDKLWQHKERFTVDNWVALLPPDMPRAVIAALEPLKVAEGLAHAFNHSRSQQQFIDHMHCWFDGFKTLKFVHLMRDSGLPSLDWHTLQQWRADTG